MTSLRIERGHIGEWDRWPNESVFVGTWFDKGIQVEMKGQTEGKPPPKRIIIVNYFIVYFLFLNIIVFLSIQIEKIETI